eukprot:TRINITY_DN10970_c0_g1_i2.p1 TRINITY_DN10970_c0_g1~~TRINITY_DN10970_c0_g1_i2.p1  ORF type:complete len:572 (+),score=159.38 TRINITY_DN10970_c0_g1_i2:78-1718(+)
MPLLLTEDQEEQKDSEKQPVGLYSKSRVKARTRQSLWNMKLERPELFRSEADKKKDGKRLPDEEDAIPPGFEPCGKAGWLHNAARQAFFEVETGRLLWFDSAANEYRDLHEGASLALIFSGAAATGLGKRASAVVPPAGTPAAGGATPSASSKAAASSGKATAPRQVMVPDLHRTAQALKADLSHLDRPSALLAVFGAASGAAAAATEAAAPALHQKLISRLAAFRGDWSDDALCAAASGALDEIAGEHGAALPLSALALAVGCRVVLAAGASGAAAHFVAGEKRVSLHAPDPGPDDGQQRSSAVAACQTLTPASAEALCVAVTAGCASLESAAVAEAARPQLLLGKPRAASAAVLRAARRCEAPQSQEPLVAGCIRLGQPLEPPPVVAVGTSTASATRPPPAKRQKTEEAPSKVRIRQILLRTWKGTGPEPQDPVRRKPIRRSAEEADALLLEVLEELAKTGPAGFTNACKAKSECQSALKGGELTGDIGWLEKEKGVSDKQANGKTVKAAVPPPVLKAAFLLEVGQLSDLVSSDLGSHLLLRTA